jgi:hypothetical protein
MENTKPRDENLGGAKVADNARGNNSNDTDMSPRRQPRHWVPNFRSGGRDSGPKPEGHAVLGIATTDDQGIGVKFGCHKHAYRRSKSTGGNMPESKPDQKRLLKARRVSRCGNP